jgi:hypothetical protein
VGLVSLVKAKTLVDKGSWFDADEVEAVNIFLLRKLARKTLGKK